MSEFAHTRDAGFWETIWEDEGGPWDLGGPHPGLRAALDLGLLEDRPRVVVPGCGGGHDAVLLAEHGHDVVGVDFARHAVERANALAAARGVTLDVRQADIFDLEREPAGSFDAAFEYTCFCAIDPAMRDRYAALLTHLIRPGGRLLMMVFPMERPPGGPPHRVTLDAVRSRFVDGWRWVIDTAPCVSPERRRGNERLAVIERT